MINVVVQGQDSGIVILGFPMSYYKMIAELDFVGIKTIPAIILRRMKMGLLVLNQREHLVVIDLKIQKEISTTRRKLRVP